MTRARTGKVSLVTGVLAPVLLLLQPVYGWDTHRSAASGDTPNVYVVVRSASTVTTAGGETLRPELVVRCQDDETGVMVNLGSGRDAVATAGGNASVKLLFDGHSSHSADLARRTDGGALYFSEPVRYIKQFIDYKKLRITFLPGAPVSGAADFDIAGLDKAVIPVRVACGWGPITADGPVTAKQKPEIRLKKSAGVATIETGSGVSPRGMTRSAAGSFAAGAAADIFLTARASNGYPERPARPPQSFDCHGRVYGVVTLRELSAGRHHLKVEWYGPGGGLREVTRYPFQANGVSDTVWAWLHLKRPPSALLDRVLFGNRASGMEEFIGDWEVKFFIDERHLETRKFKVIC